MSGGDDFLSRWSRRKHAANRGDPTPPEPARPPSPVAAAAPPAPEVQPPAPLPPVESLTPESDFSGFMRKDVDPLLRRQALKTLFRDPRFNVMDGLDVYIDDYSKPDPIPAEWLGKLNQMARLGDYKPPEEESDPREAAPQSGLLEGEAPMNQALEEEASGAERPPGGAGSPAPESKQS